MTDGSYLLTAYLQYEPAAFVGRDDADLLRQALNAAFGSPVGKGSNGRNENGECIGVAIPERKALSTMQVRP